MITHKSLAILALSSLAAAYGSGCAADSSADESDDAVTRRALIQEAVGAMRMDTGTLIAAPSKVKKVLRSMTHAKEGGLRCLPMHTVHILDVAGNEKGTLSYSCGTEPAGSERIEATLNVSEDLNYTALAMDRPPSSTMKSYVVELDRKALEDVFAAPLTVGDVLFDVDSLTLSPVPSKEAPKTIVFPAGIDDVIHELDADAVPDPTAAQARCIPDYEIHFFRAKKEVAVTTLACDGSATFTAPALNVKGVLKGIDRAALEEIRTAG